MNKQKVSNEAEKELDEIKKLLTELFEAQDNEGCGFYDCESWAGPYDKLRNKMGLNNSYFHFDDRDDSLTSNSIG